MILVCFRSHDEQSSMLMIQRHVVDGLQEKLNDLEANLQREKDERHRNNVIIIFCLFYS